MVETNTSQDWTEEAKLLNGFYKRPDAREILFEISQGICDIKKVAIAFEQGSVHHIYPQSKAQFFESQFPGLDVHNFVNCAFVDLSANQSMSDKMIESPTWAHYIMTQRWHQLKKVPKVIDLLEKRRELVNRTKTKKLPWQDRIAKILEESNKQDGRNPVNITAQRPKALNKIQPSTRNYSQPYSFAFKKDADWFDLNDKELWPSQTLVKNVHFDITPFCETSEQHDGFFVLSSTDFLERIHSFPIISDLYFESVRTTEKLFDWLGWENYTAVQSHKKFFLHGESANDLYDYKLRVTHGCSSRYNEAEKKLSFLIKQSNKEHSFLVDSDAESLIKNTKILEDYDLFSILKCTPKTEKESGEMFSLFSGNIEEFPKQVTQPLFYYETRKIIDIENKLLPSYDQFQDIKNKRRSSMYPEEIELFDFYKKEGEKLLRLCQKFPEDKLKKMQSIPKDNYIAI